MRSGRFANAEAHQRVNWSNVETIACVDESLGGAGRELREPIDCFVCGSQNASSVDCKIDEHVCDWQRQWILWRADGALGGWSSHH